MGIEFTNPPLDIVVLQNLMNPIRPTLPQNVFTDKIKKMANYDAVMDYNGHCFTGADQYYY